jgi:hypothetical protein
MAFMRIVPFQDDAAAAAAVERVGSSKIPRSF